jgi:hypothetical protein
MEKSDSKGVSIFQQKYNEFIDDLLGAVPEYTEQILLSKGLDAETRVRRFQTEVKLQNQVENVEDNFHQNPGTILPQVELSDAVWSVLSDKTKKAIWEHVRVLSLCSFMESFGDTGAKPAWMDEVMEDMKKKLESTEVTELLKKMMEFFQTGSKNKDAGNAGNAENAQYAEDAEDADEDTKESEMPDLKKMFENGFPKLPEKFLKGHLAKLAQEIVKDITPEDLGISPEKLSACEKDPSRAFSILLSTFSDNPGVIQKVIGKIGNRLKQKVQSGEIRPQEIAREAEELMKEFSTNTSFVEMMKGLKSAFGMEDLGMARKAGREGSARLAMARERLQKKLEKKREALKNKK